MGAEDMRQDYKNMKEWRVAKDLYRSDFMTNDEMNEINNFITLLNENVGRMNALYTEWEEQEEAYLANQAEEEDLPNSRMNIVLSTIEGMVSMLVNQNIAVITKGEGPEDDKYAEWAKIALDWAFRKNNLIHKVAIHERRRAKFGNAWFKLVWDESFAGGFGLPKIMCPPLNKVFVDTKIRDYLRLDEADYIAETIQCSRNFAIETYGESKANVINYGINIYRDNGCFQEDDTPMESDEEWTLIQVWSKNEGYLRLREISGCGVLLWDSHKEGDRQTNQIRKKVKANQYYKYVDNQYPYFFNIKYPQEGTLYGIGDAKLLMPLQNMLNELYDKIRIQMRPNLIGVDAHSDIDIEGFDDNSFNPVYYDGAKLNNRPPFQSIPWGTINQDIWQLINMVHDEAQRITRWSDIMIGQGKTAETATEAAITQQQGNTHVDHEKAKLELTLSSLAKYMLGMMMDKYKGGKAFRIHGDDVDKYNWIDFSKMTNVPAQIPASQSFQDAFMANNPGAEVPKWENLEENGKAETKHVELDIEINVGSGLPKNKAFIWQMIEKLSQMTGIDMEGGQPMPKPAITWKELREFIKDYLGVPLKENEEDMNQFIKAMLDIRSQSLAGMQNQQGNPMAPGEGGGMMPGSPQPQPQQPQTPLPQANAPLNQQGNPSIRQPRETVGAY